MRILSEREKEILRLVVKGKTNKEIAKALFVEPTTIRQHLTSAFKKLNARNRTHAAALFYKSRWMAE